MGFKNKYVHSQFINLILAQFIKLGFLKVIGSLPVLDWICLLLASLFNDANLHDAGYHQMYLHWRNVHLST